MDYNKSYLEKVSLSGYRSISNIDVFFQKNLNIVIGKNAVGKTNFLNFLNSILSFKFNNFNNFSTEIILKKEDSKNEYKLFFSKKTKLNTLDSISLQLAPTLFRSSFIGNLNIVGPEIKERNYEIGKEEELNLLREILIDENIFITSTFIKHGLPKQYPIIDEPLNIELLNKGISEEFIRSIIDSDSKSSFFTKIINLLITRDLIDLKFFNKKLKTEKSISKFIEDKKADYKNEILKKSSFLKDLKKTLKEYSPIEDIRINENFLIEIDNTNEKVNLKNFYIEFYVDKKWYTFNDLSDGTKRIFYIISEIFTLENESIFKVGLNIVMIEEPELGIHPHQLYQLMRFVKEKSKNTQFIITTHSPLSLDILEKNELDSIIIAKKNNGNTELVCLSEEKIEKARAYMDELNLSDFWLNSDLED
ncbi:MAG: AAA family ATPase [Flavobacteriaceae bacterium]